MTRTLGVTVGADVASSRKSGGTGREAAGESGVAAGSTGTTAGLVETKKAVAADAATAWVCGAAGAFGAAAVTFN